MVFGFSIEGQWQWQWQWQGWKGNKATECAFYATCQCQDITFYATHVSVKISHFMPHMPVSRYAPEYGKMGMFRYMSVYGLCHHTPVHATPKSFSFHKLWLK